MHLRLFLALVTSSFALTGIASAQDAKPEDQNAINAKSSPPSTLDRDSPVKFGPKSFPNTIKPDLKVVTEIPEEGYTITRSPARSLASIHEIQRKMPPGTFTPPPNDWTYLTRTHAKLTKGGSLKIMAVGDSVIADTMRSSWTTRLNEAYPSAQIQEIVYVRGGGGCQHYREERRVAKNIVPNKPDLVFIGGISQRDTQAIRDVIREIRASLPNTEILLGSGCFGKIDARYPADWIESKNNGGGPYRAELKRIAEEEKCAFLDFTPPWGEYIRSTKLHPHLFYRDPVHANEFGEQILSKILLSFFHGAPIEETGSAK